MSNIDDLNKVFKMGDTEVHALDGVSLTPPWVFHARLKSTLMPIVGCLDVPSSGSYLLDESPVEKMNDNQLPEIRNHKIGFVFQQFNLLSRTSAYENVLLPLSNTTLSHQECSQKAHLALELLGLKQPEQHHPNELSGGLQQRVAIARTLVNDPVIQRADEPTGALDSKTGVEIMKLFQILHQDFGQTINMDTRRIHCPPYRPDHSTGRPAHYLRRHQPDTPYCMNAPPGRRALRGHHVNYTKFSHRLARINGQYFPAALTILGIIIGVAAVVALMAIGNGATSSITEIIEGNGSNLFNIKPGRSSRPSAPGAMNAQTYLTYIDYQSLSKTLTAIDGIAPAYQSSFTITHGTVSASTSVTGLTKDYFSVHTYEMTSGRGLTADDRTKLRQVAVIGAATAETFFETESPLGKIIKINNASYTVVGVLASKGTTGFVNQDDVVLVPLETGYSKLFCANAIRNGEIFVSTMTLSASSADTVDSVSSQITFVLRHQHHLATDDKDDFRVSNQAELLSTIPSVTSTLTTFLGAIAALSLLVGGIGILNITLVSVSEHTKEIGLHKAVGVRKSHILFHFLVETLTLSIIGIALGAAIAWIVTLLGLITASVTLSSIIMSLSFAVAMDLFFGIYPALRAANLHPMEALRSE